MGSGIAVSRRRRKTEEEPGQDSFLDIVANLVGILIILVMVVGAQAKVAFEDPEIRQQSEEQIDALQLQVKSVGTEAAGLEHDNKRLEHKIEEEKATLSLYEAERGMLQLKARELELELEERRKRLNQEQQRSFQEQAELAEAQNRLDAITREQNTILAKETPKGVIEHLPTPIAKTVFGEEVHFRLSEGRLAYLPMDELVEAMRGEWKVKAEKLLSAPETIETVGPIGDFRLQYKLMMVNKTLRTERGLIQRQVPEFVGFILRPVRPNIGTTLDHELQPGSSFSRMIDGLDPKNTTISVWVYPDSYSDFIRLKRWLFDRGFLTASWPLPEGQPISGGPNGYRSTAQ